MRLLLDEQPCEVHAGSIGEAIRSAAALAEDRGRLIIEVIVDGDRWDEEQLASEEACAGVAEEIRCTSASRDELVARTLTDAADALTRADELQREAAELIQTDQAAEAKGMIGRAVNIWLTVLEAVARSAEALQLDLGTFRVAGEPLPASIERLKERLQSLQAALQMDDSVAVSDTLLYELPDVVTEWREILNDMQDHIQGEQI